MIIYSEDGNIINNPDLERGWIERKISEVVKVHHPAVSIKYHIEERDGKKIRVIDQQPKDAWNEHEECGVYHPYTQEELDRMEEERNKPTQEERIAQLEEELKAAKILLGLEV